MRSELPHPTIKHVIVLMLENRGFDHLMGWLYAPDAEPNIVSFEDDERPFIGLSTLSEQQLTALQNPAPRGDPVPVIRGARSPKTPAFNTGETYEHIMNQLWGLGLRPERWQSAASRAQIQLPQAQTMTGFVLDYDLEALLEASADLNEQAYSEVMETYLPPQMPVLSGLARTFAVSDEWYCSVPSQTNTNRAFSFTGTSRGMVDNSFYDPPSWNLFLQTLKRAFMHGKSHADQLPPSTRSFFEVLEENNFAWKVFWQSEWPPLLMTAGVEWEYTRTMIPLLQDKQFNDNFVKFDFLKPDNPFYTAIDRGELPAVSWIEPLWGGGAQWHSVKRGVGNDYHPVSDTTVGEDFVSMLYKRLIASPKWNQTLLIITFDENGGTYDHVVPPQAVPSGTDACPWPEPPVNRHDMDPNTRSQFGFQFNQYGVRVPTILVSPQVQQGTIFRSTDETTPFDHTSILATVLSMADIPKARWSLGARTENAPTFEAAFAAPPPSPAPPTPERGWESALSLPDLRSNLQTLLYNTGYIFEYVGDIFRARPRPLFLAAVKSGPTGLHPTLTANSDNAVRLRFRPLGGGGGSSTPVLNLSVMNLTSTEPAIDTSPYLTVTNTWSWTFYSADPNALGANWQVRLLGSRDSRDEVKAGDYVYFVSQLARSALSYISQGTPFDPIQRLLPYPRSEGDMRDPKYVTTRAGEWGLWRVHYALPDPT